MNVITGEIRLWDSQWVNIVNAPEVRGASDIEEAVAIAVRMTERAIAVNVQTGSLPPSIVRGMSVSYLLCPSETTTSEDQP